MKYNKREKQAIRTLEIILEVLKGEHILGIIDIYESDANSLREVFGYDILKASYSKGEIDKYIRGKEEPMIRIQFYGVSGPYFKYCFFPFQVKLKK